jgi:hypothetical protein
MLKGVHSRTLLNKLCNALNIDDIRVRVIDGTAIEGNLDIFNANTDKLPKYYVCLWCVI